MEKREISILLVDDHNLLRNALARMIRTFKFPSIINEASNGKEALEFLSVNHADLLLLDVQMPVLGGIETIKKIKELGLSTCIIVLTQFSEISLVINLLQLGANGFLLKGCQPEELENAITKVLSEGYYFSTEIEILIKEGIRKRHGLANLELSPREFQVLFLIKDGKSNKEISKSLNLKLRTIESYRKALMKKLNCKNTAELVAIFYRTGMS